MAKKKRSSRRNLIPERDALGRTGAEARDDGMALAFENERVEWREAARDVVRRLPPGAFLIGEDVRETVLSEIDPPHSPKVWGSLINYGIKEGILVPTERSRPMRDPRSHARGSRVYRVNGDMGELAGAMPCAMRPAESILAEVREGLERIRRRAKGRLADDVDSLITLITEWETVT